MQTASLPTTMYSDFSGETRAALFCPSTNPEHYDSLSIGATFDTDTAELELEWHWCAPTATALHHEVETYSLGYQPTAFCKQSGAGPTMYVAGFIPRTGHVIVERWEITDLLLGQAATQPDGAVLSFLSKNIRKSVLLVSDEVQPIRSMAFHHTQGVLWLMEESAPHVVWALDPDNGSPTYLFDSSTYPEIADKYSMRSLMVDSAAPQGGGFVVALMPWRAWKPKWASPNKLEWGDEVFVARDANCDGIVDEWAQLTIYELVEIRQYFAHQVLEFH